MVEEGSYFVPGQFFPKKDGTFAPSYMHAYMYKRMLVRTYAPTYA